MRIPAAAALALAAIVTVSAAPAPDPIQAFTCANGLLARGEYLKATDLLSEAAAGEKDPNGVVHQFGEQVTPFVTGKPPTASLLSEAKPGADDLKRLARADLHDAIDAIVERARHTNIVILNEEHTAPRDRAFALQVARALRPLGYSYLAAEGFASAADSAEREAKAKTLADARHPRLNTGLYTKDPVFGDFVRQSLAMGYRPVVYEYVAPKGSPPAADAAREQGEADNLMHQLLANDPSAKILIYVGYSHAAEVPLAAEDGLVRMAARLKHMTGVDPLTIDQTTLSPSSLDPKGRAFYAALKSRLSGQSLVPILNGKPLTFGALGPGFDLQVVHPPARTIQGRPDWLRAMGRKPVPIPAELRPRSGQVLVQAFLDGEPDDAVPVDQVVVTAGQKPPPLLLPPGAVHFKIRTGYRPGDCDAPHA